MIISDKGSIIIHRIEKIYSINNSKKGLNFNNKQKKNNGTNNNFANMLKMEISKIK